MSCRRVTRWIDRLETAASVEPGADLAAHVAGCPRCRAVLAAAAAVELALSATPPPAPPGFADRVMARVRAVRPGAAAWPMSPSLPWWVRATADPGAVAAALAAAVTLAAGPEGFAAFAHAWSRWLTPPVAPADPMLVGAVLIAVAPLVCLAAIVLYRWTVAAVSLGSPLPRPR